MHVKVHIHGTYYLYTLTVFERKKDQVKNVEKVIEH